MNIEMTPGLAEELERLEPRMRQASERGDVVVLTSHGVPVVALIKVHEVDDESRAVYAHPLFQRLLAQTRRDRAAGKLLSAEEVRRSLGTTDEELAAVDVEAELARPPE